MGVQLHLFAIFSNKPKGTRVAVRGSISRAMELETLLGIEFPERRGRVEED
jgi:hypothetical protein